MKKFNARRYIARLRGWYESKNTRERFMLLGVVWVFIALWLSSLTARTRALSAEAEALDKRENIANVAIKQSPTIQKRLDSCLKKFDSGRTVSSINLQIFSENCAQDAKLSYSLSSSTVSDAGKFKINTITLSCSKSDVSALQKFEERLSEYEPYLSVSKATFDSDSKGNASVRYQINSFEFASDKTLE